MSDKKPIEESIVIQVDELLALRRERDEARAEAKRYANREARYTQMLAVADEGAYQADWETAIKRVVRERDEARERLLAYDEHLTAVMPADYKDWHENDRSEWPVVAAETIKALRQRWDEAERERDAAVAQRDALKEAIGTREEVEGYIRALPWSGEDSDHDRTLVAGNLRTFHAWIEERAGLGGDE